MPDPLDPAGPDWQPLEDPPPAPLAALGPPWDAAGTPGLSLRRRRPPFWERTALLALVHARSRPRLVRHALFGPWGVARLDGTAAPLLAAAEAEPPALGGPAALDWLCLWLAAVSGPEDSFRLVTGAEDVLLDDTARAEDRLALVNHIQRPRVASDRTAAVTVEACFTLRDALIAAQVTLGRDGAPAFGPPRILLRGLPLAMPRRLL